MKFSVITSSYNQKELFKKSLLKWEEQLFTDFELIVADDGSSDGTRRWLHKQITSFPLEVVHQEHEGYRFSKIMNEAATQARGDYIVFVNGDTFPREDFLQELSETLTPLRMVNGVRINIDWDTDEPLSIDWRMELAPLWIKEQVINHNYSFPITRYSNPWTLMTMTGMALPRTVFEEVGGLSKVYDEGYGKMDWSLAMKVFYSGYELWWNTQAVLYHKNHKGLEDTEDNTQAFEQELQEWRLKYEN